MKTILPYLSCALAESPIWDDRQQILYWVDITLGILHAFTPDTSQHKSWHFREKISCIGLSEGEEILVAGKSGIWRFNPQDGQRMLWAKFPPHSQLMRPNEGKIGPDGAFWVSTMEDQEKRGPNGKLYRFAIDGSAKCMINGLVTPNGLDWSPDGSNMYIAETRALYVTRWSFDIHTGSLHNPQPFLMLRENQGKPDGACVDREGNYWLCGIYSGSVQVYSPKGNLLKRIEVGTNMVTMPCFGGRELDTLFVTSLTRGNNSPGSVRYMRIAGVQGRQPHRIKLLAAWPSKMHKLNAECHS
ncbi:MAG: SMP-30/gluconolactonase/LRE family protein [Balneolales bacterium]